MGEGDWGGGGEGGVVGWVRWRRRSLPQPHGEYPQHSEDVKIAAGADELLLCVARFIAIFNGANYLYSTRTSLTSSW